MHPLAANLRQGLVALQLDLGDAQVQQLLAYLDLIQKWTQVYNLTAVRDPAEMLTHHLLDSLAAIRPLRAQLVGLRAVRQSFAQPVAVGADGSFSSVIGSGEGSVFSATEAEAEAEASTPVEGVRLLDVGSGAGLPGVVIAICCPDLTVHCVDTVAKKAAFIQQVAASLRLPNLRGIHARVESLADKYHVISSRAFASLADFTAWSANALAEQGVWMGMKGKHPVDEIVALHPLVEVFHVEQLAVPGLDAQRCIVWMRAS